MSTLKDTAPEETKRALLVSIFLNQKVEKEATEHMQELELLTETFGAEIIGREICVLRKTESATYLTSGKVDEFIAIAKEKGANLIILDADIAPSQQRNLEALFKIPVMDRTELILAVFAERAQTKEAKLQIELAKVRYQAPRLKRLWTHLSRQQGSAGGGAGGGGGYLKGEGEKQIEIDRRILKQKIEQLEEQIEEVRVNRQLQRNMRERSEIPTFAIVGYTNAGKSTLMNALTQAGVFVENKLFATLDTTTRKLVLPNNQEILLIDTVGFIRKLPHLLVAAFKSTLEEAVYADILLHMVDISHEAAFEQAETTFQVLKELNADDRPILNVLNKVDLVKDRAAITKFRIKYPHTIEISAKEGQGIDTLLNAMVEELKKRRRLVKLRIPQSDYVVVSEIMRLGNVAKTDYEDNDVLMTVDMPIAQAEKWKKYSDEPSQ